MDTPRKVEVIWFGTVTDWADSDISVSVPGWDFILVDRPDGFIEMVPYSERRL